MIDTQKATTESVDTVIKPPTKKPSGKSSKTPTSPISKQVSRKKEGISAIQALNQKSQKSSNDKKGGSKAESEKVQQ